MAKKAKSKNLASIREALQDARDVEIGEKMTASDVWRRAEAEIERGNLKGGADLFETAIEMGDVTSINSLGYCYDIGQGRKRDRDKAEALYKRAARLGETTAMNNLGVLYRDDGNVRLSEKWFMRAVAAGDPGAAIELAKLQIKRSTSSALILAERHLRVAEQGGKNALLSEFEEEEVDRLMTLVQLQRKAKRT
jgi:TPR repeat protein